MLRVLNFDHFQSNLFLTRIFGRICQVRESRRELLCSFELPENAQASSQLGSSQHFFSGCSIGSKQRYFPKRPCRRWRLSQQQSRVVWNSGKAYSLDLAAAKWPASLTDSLFSQGEAGHESIDWQTRSTYWHHQWVLWRKRLGASTIVIKANVPAVLSIKF